MAQYQQSIQVAQALVLTVLPGCQQQPHKLSGHAQLVWAQAAFLLASRKAVHVSNSCKAANSLTSPAQCGQAEQLG